MLTTPPPDSGVSRRIGHPRRRPQIREFFVNDEVILVARGAAGDGLDRGADNRALTLNRSGRAIWELCDGSHSIDDLVGVLAARFPVDREMLFRQVHDTVARMSELGFIDDLQRRSAARIGMTFVIGIEDKPYFWWQTAIFLESLKGKLPPGWQTLVVVCNNGEPISKELRHILLRYETRFAEATNHAKTNRLDIGNNGGEYYAALNRVEALSAASRHVDDGDMICLTDSDIFFYRDLNVEIMPVRCAATKNWHVDTDLFFSSSDGNKGKGIYLGKMLEAIGCDRRFKPGAVNVFVTGEVAKNRKYIADCFRFAHAIFLLGRVAGAENVWMAEMPCFTLAMTANGIDYDLLERKEFLVSDCDEPSIPAGTIYHYYSDPADFGRTAFRGSKWFKQAYRHENFLRSDLGQFAADATTDHERYFFALAENARRRLYA